jgi:hypothetical protein
VKIIVSCICPPIPTRNYDWQAYVDGREEEGPYGYGATSFDAKWDLLQQLEEKRLSWTDLIYGDAT